MNSDAIAWLNSPESDKWREDNFTRLYALVSLKEDIGQVIGFLWRA